MPQAANRVEKIIVRKIADLRPAEYNPRQLSEDEAADLKASLTAFGFIDPVIVNKHPERLDIIVGGHQRCAVWGGMGHSEVPTVEVFLSPAQEREAVVRLNKNTGSWDWDVLANNFGMEELTDWGFKPWEFGSAGEWEGGGGGNPEQDGEQDEEKDSKKTTPPVTLAERFGVPPFSILDGRQGYWQARKRAWLALGISSEIGRGGNLLDFSPQHMLSMLTGGKSAAAYDKLNKIKQQYEAELGRELSREEFCQAFLEREKANRNYARAFGNAKKWQADNAEGAAPSAVAAILAADGRDGLIAAVQNGEIPWEGTVTVDADGPLTPERAAIIADALIAQEKGDATIAYTGTSVFDPVLCEMLYRWFCPLGGQVLDPFAGGSVRGIVASRLGRKYWGMDLSAPQIEANRQQAEQLCGGGFPKPEWTVGDSAGIADAFKGEADFLFSCPPYFDLEKYSDDPRDLSNLEWAAFKKSYRAIIKAAASKLRPDSFAAFVVGEVRSKGGAYRGLVPETIAAFEAAGLHFYNEAILVTPVGSLPIRLAAQFEGSRKIGKTHQNVLVFVKGDAKAATARIGPVEFGESAALDVDPEPALADAPETIEDVIEAAASRLGG